MKALDYIPLSVTAGRRLTTTELTRLALDRMWGLGYPIVLEQCSPPDSGLRFDVVGIAAVTRQVRIYEIKSSRGDFLADDKWERYLPFCTQFAFVAPAGAIARWEVPPDIGLIEYGAPGFERMRAARRYGATIFREDCLRTVRPSRRLRDMLADREWTALLEAALFGRGAALIEPSFSDGMGI